MNYSSLLMFYVFYLDARSVSLKQRSVVSRLTSIQAGKETVASISVSCHCFSMNKNIFNTLNSGVKTLTVFS